MKLVLSIVLCFVALSAAYPGKRITFDKNTVKNAQNEFRHIVNPSSKPFTWSTALEKQSWNVARQCSLAVNDKVPGYWGAVASQQGTSVKYSGAKTLGLIEDSLEAWCPGFLGDKRLSKFACAVARCPPIKSLSKNYKDFSSLKQKGLWDNIVCRFDKVLTNTPCYANGKSNKQHTFIGHNLQFSHSILTKWHNELRHADDATLMPIKWNSTLEQKAHSVARECQPKIKATGDSFGESLSGPWSTPSLSTVNLKLYLEDPIERCPDLVTNPDLKSFACSGVICPGIHNSPNSVVKKPWASIVCFYDTPSKSCHGNADQ